MITAEAYTRKENKNASEDFVRGAEALLRYESVFSDFIEAEKESFEFNRGATWGLQRFIMAPAKDESLNYGDRMTVVGSFTGDYIKSKENALQAYLDFADEYNDQVAIEHLRKEIAWAKQIEANKSNE